MTTIQLRSQAPSAEALRLRGEADALARGFYIHRRTHGARHNWDTWRTYGDLWERVLQGDPAAMDGIHYAWLREAMYSWTHPTNSGLSKPVAELTDEERAYKDIAMAPYMLMVTSDMLSGEELNVDLGHPELRQPISATSESAFIGWLRERALWDARSVRYLRVLRKVINDDRQLQRAVCHGTFHVMNESYIQRLASLREFTWHIVPKMLGVSYGTLVEIGRRMSAVLFGGEKLQADLVAQECTAVVSGTFQPIINPAGYGSDVVEARNRVVREQRAADAEAEEFRLASDDEFGCAEDHEPTIDRAYNIRRSREWGQSLLARCVQTLEQDIRRRLSLPPRRR